MVKILDGRWTNEHPGEVTVFLIGMRPNVWWRITNWLPSALAMPRMLAELRRNPAKGFLGGDVYLGLNGIMTVQYWAGVDDLYAYASDASGNHPAAWRAYFARDRKAPGATGVWHETYVVPVGGTETVYDHMPRMGLAAASGAVRVTPRSSTARMRLAGQR
jgi:hypothetical protein